MHRTLFTNTVWHAKEEQMRILHLEDDEAVARSVALMLARGFDIEHTADGEQGCGRALTREYDLILLELELPGISGMEVLKRVRFARVRTPIIVLSRLTGVEPKVKALQIGADDFITKPFNKDELAARIHAVVRRSCGYPDSVVSVRGLTLELAARRVSVRGTPLSLTDKEHRMLELLMLRMGITITKEAFLNHLYGGIDEPELKIVDVFICKLRKKLETAGCPGLIETVWGRGYRIMEDVPAT